MKKDDIVRELAVDEKELVYTEPKWYQRIFARAMKMRWVRWTADGILRNRNWTVKKLGGYTPAEVADREALVDEISGKLNSLQESFRLFSSQMDEQARKAQEDHQKETDTLSAAILAYMGQAPEDAQSNLGATMVVSALREGQWRKEADRFRKLLEEAETNVSNAVRVGDLMVTLSNQLKVAGETVRLPAAPDGASEEM